MFFITSKIFEFFFAPLHFFIFLLIIATLLLYTKRSCLGRRLVSVSALALFLMAFGPIGALLAVPLETRFPAPPIDMPAPDGVIILGGAIDEKLSETLGRPVLIDAAAERLTAAVALKRRYPEMRIIFTGGTSALTGSTYREADGVKRFWGEMGLNITEISFEDRSRNTYENAVFTRALATPGKDERWLLVTSAMHMPRAIGVFRKAGFSTIAYPVDYRTTGKIALFSAPRFSTRALSTVQFAAHEWLGLVIYWLTGKTTALLPEP